jgi:RNA polymerase sigma factor for flagellar operon FliA
LLQSLKPRPGGAGSTSPERLFLDNLKLVERVVAWACRTHYCRGEEAEEFAAQVKIKLVDHDYAVLRKYSGKSTLKTYLSAVVLNYFHDYRNHLWGKWRPSAEATRLGEVAIKLEELVWRDGRGFDEACETLRINFKLDVSQAELERISARLPQKPPRRLVSEDELSERPSLEARPEAQIHAQQLRASRRRVATALDEALASLPDDDLLVIRLCIFKGMKLADVARSLGLDEKALYRRKDRILARLRQALEERGVAWPEVAELLNREEIRWE